MISKDTVKFILLRHFSNGFVIWSYTLFGFNYIKDIPVIESFRTALLIDQVMWVFLIPMLVQNWFYVSTKLEMKNIQYENTIDNLLFPGIITASVMMIVVSFTIFIWDSFSIIPSMFPEAWAHETIDFQTYSIGMLIGGHLSSAGGILFVKIERYFVKKYSVKEESLWPKKFENKVNMMIFVFVIPLIIFLIYNCMLEPRFLV